MSKIICKGCQGNYFKNKHIKRLDICILEGTCDVCNQPTTSSEGCKVVYDEVFDEFIKHKTK